MLQQLSVLLIALTAAQAQSSGEHSLPAALAMVLVLLQYCGVALEACYGQSISSSMQSRQCVLSDSCSKQARVQGL